MARNGKSPKANSRNPKDWKDFEFVNVSMSDTDKAHFKELQETASDELDDSLVTLVEGGYKLSASWDGSNDCFIVSLTCKHETDDNYGYVLSSRSNNLLEAMRLGVFKTMYLCKDGVWPKDTKQNSWG